MPEVCKICGCNVASIRGERRSLVGKAAGVSAVYSSLFDSLHEEYSVAAAEIHQYLTSQPTFTCKSCFTTFKKYTEVRDEIVKLKTKLCTGFEAFRSRVSCVFFVQSLRMHCSSKPLNLMYADRRAETWTKACIPSWFRSCRCWTISKQEDSVKCEWTRVCTMQWLIIITYTPSHNRHKSRDQHKNVHPLMVQTLQVPIYHKAKGFGQVSMSAHYQVQHHLAIVLAEDSTSPRQQIQVPPQLQ